MMMKIDYELMEKELEGIIMQKKICKQSKNALGFVLEDEIIKSLDNYPLILSTHLNSYKANKDALKNMYKQAEKYV